MKFVERRRKIRSSLLRPPGTTVTHPINLDKNIYRGCIIQKLIPEIHGNWLSAEPELMHVQLDNAPAHMAANDEFIAERCKSNKWHIVLRHQPLNSPDFNILDLRFFGSLQSATEGHNVSTINKVVQFVTTDFENIARCSLNDVFLSLIKHMETSQSVQGGTPYKELDLGKKKLHRSGAQHADVVYCDQSEYDYAIAIVETSEL